MAVATYINSERNAYLYLYADCFLTKGYARSVLVDRTEQEIYFITNDTYDLLKMCRYKKIGEVLDTLASQEDKEYFNELINWLIECSLAKTVKNILLFPEINMEWDHPSVITNAIVDIRNVAHDYKDIFFQLNQLACECIQLRFYKHFPMSYYTELLLLANEFAFKSVQLVISFYETYTSADYIRFQKKFPFLDYLILYSAPYDDVLINQQESYGCIQLTTQSVDSCASCGIINMKSMSIPKTPQEYSENYLYNSCLNRKISIDEYGNIKNCPSMKKSYGNICDTTLEEVVKQQSFKEIWNINKDKINTCKVCEFRHMCSDCRAYTTDGGLMSKPLKCNYDPYTTTFN